MKHSPFLDKEFNCIEIEEFINNIISKIRINNFDEFWLSVGKNNFLNIVEGLIILRNHNLLYDPINHKINDKKDYLSLNLIGSFLNIKSMFHLSLYLKKLINEQVVFLEKKIVLLNMMTFDQDEINNINNFDIIYKKYDVSTFRHHEYSLLLIKKELEKINSEYLVSELKFKNDLNFNYAEYLDKYDTLS